MRIYLACTVRGERSGVLAGRAICDRLQQLGHEVLTTHLLAEDVESAEAQLTEQQVYRRDIDWLSQCDVLGRRSWLVRVVALFDPTVRPMLPLLDNTRHATSAKAERLLGW